MSPLLDLPPELRNSIYEAVISSGLVLELKHGHTNPHPLNRTCRLVRKEFLPIYEHATPDAIEAEVTGFDLRTVETLLKSRPTFLTKDDHKISICIILTDPNREAETYDMLEQWLRGCKQAHFTRPDRNWMINYTVLFDWQVYSLADAQLSFQFFSSRFSVLGENFAMERIREAMRDSRIRRERVYARIK